VTSHSILRAGSARAIPNAVPPLIGLALGLFSLPARGLPPPIDPDDDPRRPLLTREETTPHELYGQPSGRGSLWIAVNASLHRGKDGIPTYGAMLLLGVPLERLATRRPASVRIAEGAKQEEKAKPAPPAPGERPPPLRLPVQVTPSLARGAVQAALSRAKLADPDARLDALVSRARSSALLPELRVRVSRTIDEGQTLSPTEYDPARTTATSTAGLWLEARATWRLDRLVFADDEVALERVRAQRAEAQAKVIERVLGLLFSWQRALALADGGAASPEEHLAATLKAIEAEVELDLMTGGWFSKQREKVAR